MKTSEIAIKLTPAVLVLAAGISTTALADSYGETVVSTPAHNTSIVTVSYEDLDLSSQEGLVTMHNRIERAAEQVCGYSDFRRAGSLSQARDNRACAENAISEAIGQLNSRQVAGLGN